MALTNRLREFLKNHDKTMAFLLALAVSLNTVVLETAGVSANGGP
jgi:hypothetical protein